MAAYDDALRGYAFEVNKRDNFTCRYCGLDGRASFSAWLNLGVEHLLPKGHPDRNKPVYMVTACRFCSGADNRRFMREDGGASDGMTPDELVVQRREAVQAVRDDYMTFWADHVQQAAAPAQEAFDVVFFYIDDESPFVMLQLTQAPQVGSPVRIVYGNYIYSGVVEDVQWRYDFSYEKAREGGDVTVNVILKRHEKVV